MRTVYLRIASEGLLSVRANIWDSFEYIKADELDTCIVGIILGVILAVFIYTLLIAISLREGSYGFYLGYLMCFLVTVVAACGAGQAFLWVRSSWAGRRIYLLFTLLMDAGIALFIREFLGIKRRSSTVSAGLLVLACVALISALGLSFLDLRVASLEIVALDLVARLAVLAVALGSLRAKEGYDPRRAWFFSSAYAMALAGLVVARLGQFGLITAVLPSLWATGEEYGTLAQVMILSYGITDAINVMRTEKEEEQRRSIEYLERANKVKEDFVIGTSLEFRSPLFGIVGLVDALEGLSSGGAGPEERRLISLIRAEALRLLGSVANIAAYAQLRNGDMALSPTAPRSARPSWASPVRLLTSRLARILPWRTRSRMSRWARTSASSSRSSTTCSPTR